MTLYWQLVGYIGFFWQLIRTCGTPVVKRLLCQVSRRYPWLVFQRRKNTFKVKTTALQPVSYSSQWVTNRKERIHTGNHKKKKEFMQPWPISNVAWSPNTVRKSGRDTDPTEANSCYNLVSMNWTLEGTQAWWTKRCQNTQIRAVRCNK